MNALGNAVRGIRNIWGHGDEDDAYDSDDTAPTSSPSTTPSPLPSSLDSSPSSYASSTTSSTASSTSFRAEKSYGSYGGGSASGTRRPRAVPMALRREKNIYTLKPKNLEETAIAADHLKTGSAVVINLDDVDRFLATRIIDFMSGVCYGLDSQGHAMKLGDTIFLFTPGEFEISSDETDYGENRDFFFKDTPAAVSADVLAALGASQRNTTSGATAGSALRDTRAWET